MNYRPSDIKASATPKRTLRPGAGAGCNPLAGVKKNPTDSETIDRLHKDDLS